MNVVTQLQEFRQSHSIHSECSLNALGGFRTGETDVRSGDTDQ
jgi:predicted DNA-binding protein with PD1-like motif